MKMMQRGHRSFSTGKFPGREYRQEQNTEFIPTRDEIEEARLVAEEARQSRDDVEGEDSQEPVPSS